MTAAISTLRQSIATALANPGVWSTFSYPPATILANSVIVAPGEPYITPTNNSYTTISPLANFKIIMTVPLFDNQGNLAGIEDTIVAVYKLLDASSIVFDVGTVSAPSVLNVASGDLLTSHFTISVLTNWS